MPNFYAHTLAANRAVVMISHPGIKAAIQEYPKVFNLGAQGPDFFFFYRAYPWGNPENFHEIGNRAHVKDTGKLFQAAMRYIQGKPVEERKLLAAYLCGFLTHYALDSVAHPYVLYFTGDITQDSPGYSRFSRNHTRFEAAIDAWLIWEQLGKAPPAVKKLHLFDITPEAALQIGEMLAHTLATVHQVSVLPAKIATAFTDLADLTRVIIDPWHPLALVAHGLGRWLDPHGTGRATFYPQDATVAVPFLNLERTPWKFAWDGMPQPTSFLDLMEQGVADSAQFIEAAGKVMLDGGSPAVIADLIGNRSMLTGLDCDQPEPLSHFDLKFCKDWT